MDQSTNQFPRTESEDHKPNRSSNRAQRNQEAHEHARKLAAEGHTCIRIMESYPIKVGWCQSTPCKGK